VPTSCQPAKKSTKGVKRLSAGLASWSSMPCLTGRGLLSVKNVIEFPLAAMQKFRVKKYELFARQPIAPLVPMTNKRWNGFSATDATQGSKARLHQTQPPNALPASERCPGQPRMLFNAFHSQHPVRIRSWRRPFQLCGFMIGQPMVDRQSKIIPCP